MGSKKIVWWNPTTWFQKKKPIVPPAVGDYWPEMEGYYAGVIGFPGNFHLVVNSRIHHYEAKPFGWVPEEFQKGRLRQGPKPMNSLRDGVWNTLAAIGYREIGSDYQGWYIPSIHELLLVRLNCKDVLHASKYWSSTQINPGFGCCIDTFPGGDRADIQAPVTNGYYVAMVKRIPVEKL